MGQATISDFSPFETQVLSLQTILKIRTGRMFHDLDCILSSTWNEIEFVTYRV